MNLKQCIFYDSDVYKAEIKMLDNKPTGIVVHSTGANNPYLKRCVQPSKNDKKYSDLINDLGINRYNNHWNNPSSVVGRYVGVHAFIGKTANDEISTYQVLPFDICCSAVGSGKNGSYNNNPNARIQFEIMEDSLTDEKYFKSVYKEAVEFCAYLCEIYNLSVDKICSHTEAYRAGYGGNHGDPEHWFKRYGKTMVDFRNDVNNIITVIISKTYTCDISNAQATIKGDKIYFTGSTIPIWKEQIEEPDLKIGDKVKLKVGSTVYGSDKKFSGWVYNSTLYVRSINNDKVVISTLATGAITGVVRKEDLIKT